MGFPTTHLVKAVDPNLICGICSGVLDGPVLTPCGHTFCEGCINTWLDTASVSSCPECRSTMDKSSVRPILSLRNLILGLEVSCPNKSRGCKEVFRIESLDNHKDECQHASVLCEICQNHVDKSKLESHQVYCKASNSTRVREEINYTASKNPPLALLVDEKDRPFSPSYPDSFISTSRMHSRINVEDNGSAHITYLLQRIKTLEKQISRLLDNLHQAHRKNSVLYFQNKQLKEYDCDRPRKQHSSTDMKYGLAGYSVEYSVTCQQDIAKLSLHIAKHLLQKPPHVDRDKVFSAIRQCYEMQFYLLSKNSQIDHDIHMLLATAYSSNWFTGAQRILLGCWLQCVLKN